MMNRFHSYLPLVCGLFLLISCNNGGNGGHHAPIVLGDSSTIVSENDPQNLQDMVTDIKPAASDEPAKDTVADVATAPASPVTASTQSSQKVVPVSVPPSPAPSAVTGLTIPFKETTIIISGVIAKGYRNQNPIKPNGAVYQFVSGNINGSKIVIANGNSLKVSQRYQTMMVLKNESGVLPLESLSNTTDWVPLLGKNNSYTISGLAPGNMESADISPSILKAAINKAARRHHLSRQKMQQWLSSVSKIRNTPQKPLSVMLRSVIWKVDGRDANKKQFSKQIRIDVDAS